MRSSPRTSHSAPRLLFALALGAVGAHDASGGGIEALVTGSCTPLADVDAGEVREQGDPLGRVGTWLVYGDRALACSEPFLGDRLECDLAPGGRAVLTTQGEMTGFTNQTGTVVSVLVDARGVRCVPARSDLR